MAVDFPSSPTPGQVYTQAGATWTWDGVKWVAQGTGTGIYLPLAGGTMTGDITLKGDPTAALQPVTKQMLDARALAMNDNRIINGDMRIDQRNNGASGTANNSFTADRWTFGATLATKGTWGQKLNAIVGPVGFPYCLGFQSNSAYAVVAGDYFAFLQAIEADAVSDFAWGTANAQAVTLSFWAYSSKTGAFGGAINNYAANRSYPFSYSIPTANTWTKITLTVPGDTGGTWVMSGNGGSVNVWFSLGVGSTYSRAAGAWAAGNYLSATGSVSVVATNGATFYITGVKLEIGSVATPFNRQSLAKSMADCQRYYQTINVSARGYAPGAGYHMLSNVSFPTMRASPTTNALSGGTGGNISSAPFTILNPWNATIEAISLAAGDTYALNVVFSLSAEL